MTGPTSERWSSRNNPEDKAIIEEGEAIKKGVGEVTLAWSELETWFVILLHRTLGGGVRADIVSEIYFSPASIDVRTRLVSEAFMRLFAQHAVQVAVYPKWRTFMNFVGRLRQTRNKVAHHQLILFSSSKGSVYRLAPPIVQNDDERAKILMRGGRVGLGSNELCVHLHSLEKARKRIQPFIRCAELFHKGDIATLLRTLAEATTQPHSPPAPDTPSSPAPSSPPPPSPEKSQDA